MKLKIFIPLFIILSITSKLFAYDPSIIVHDYIQDFKLHDYNKDTLKIDLNNDSINDVVFYLMRPSSGNVLIVEPFYSDCYIFIAPWTSYFLNIDSLNWSSSRWFVQIETNDKTGQIGIKIISNGKIYYGWIKAYYKNIGFDTFWYVDKYAFCTIPDYPLLWGQTELTGTKEIKVLDKIKVTVDNQSQSINIQTKEVVKEISLINSAGRVIRKWRNIKSSIVDIPSTGIKVGIYLLRIKTENNEIVTEKIVL